MTAYVTGEQGLLDIAVDTDFAQNGYIYVYYTNGSANRNRLSRFTMTGNSIDSPSEFVIWQNNTSARSIHHGGAIAFGADGKIYVATGDRDTPTEAQQLTNPNGKILRLNFDGTIPTDNPFYDGAGPVSDEIWAYGLRNPFRMSIDPVTGNMYIGDVGGDLASSHEELDLGIAGANYGWPDCEGPCSIPGVTSPIYSYVHGSLSRDASITNGFIYRGSQFPAEYDESYIFADYAQNWIRRLTFTDSTLTEVDQLFYVDPPDDTLDEDLAIGDPVDIKEGPDGAIYYIDFDFAHNPNHSTSPSPAGIRRIRYVGNRPPIAVISADVTSGAAPLAVAFSSAGTSDPENDPLTYQWDFGDGATSTESHPTHIYQTNGPYTARLVVSDGESPALSNGIAIQVGIPPVATILGPADDSTFRAGDTIVFAGEGTDAEDGALPESALTWEIEFLHNNHVHPAGTYNGVANVDFPIPTVSGHNYVGNTRYRANLTVTDSDGLSHTSSVTVYPEKVNLSFDSVPSGRTITLDGIGLTTPFVIDTLIDYQHTIEALENAQYTFESWSDGGSQAHTITVPEQDTSYTATYTENPLPQDLIAAYAFDEGAGGTTADATGNGHTGTLISGPTWDTGQFGGALSFAGGGEYVVLGSSPALDNMNAFTYCVWVYPESMGGQNDARIIHKGTVTQRKQFQIDSGVTNSLGLAVDRSTNGAHAISAANTLDLNTWQYVCATYDETDGPRIYENGTEVFYSQRTVGSGSTSDDSSENLRIGNRNPANKGWDGRIDELRIYDRVITPAEMQSDMGTSVGGGTLPPPTITLLAPSEGENIVGDSVTVQYDIPTQLDPGDHVHFYLDGGPVVMDTAVTGSFTFTDVPVGAHTLTAILATGTHSEIPGSDDTVNFTTSEPPQPDTTAPSAPSNVQTSAVSSARVDITWTASVDPESGIDHYVVYRDGVSVGQATDTTFSDIGLTAETTYTYEVTAVNGEGLESTASTPPVVVTTPMLPAQNPNLIAAYAFDEGAGGTTADATGNGHTGTLVSGPTWDTGQFGGALSFAGGGEYVVLGSSPALDNMNAFTYCAWVYPESMGGQDDARIIHKGTVTQRKQFQIDSGVTNSLGLVVDRSTNGAHAISVANTLDLNTWQYVCATYDETDGPRIYKNGTEVFYSQRTVGSGSTSDDSSENLRIGNRNPANKGWDGRIDELRIYDRVITPAEMQSDMG